MARLDKLFHGKPVTHEDLQWLQEKLLFDRIPVGDRYVRFVVMLFLSTVIATYGVVGDSTATVIGAMIVAPLMTPIMAVSLSAISGDSRNISTLAGDLPWRSGNGSGAGVRAGRDTAERC